MHEQNISSRESASMRNNMRPHVYDAAAAGAADAVTNCSTEVAGVSAVMLVVAVVVAGAAAASLAFVVAAPASAGGAGAGCGTKKQTKKR